MKKILSTIFIICFSLAISAQTENITNNLSYTATLGTAMAVNTPSSTPITWQFLGHYNLTEHWKVGAGTGLSFYEKTLLPIWADAKYQIGKEKKFTPYIEWAIGYGFALQQNANGGFFTNPSLGLQYSLKNTTKLQLAIGYEIQKLDRLKSHQDSYFYKEFTERLNHQSISIKIGVQF